MVVLGISLLMTATAVAEEAPTLAPGARVRVTVTTQEKRVVGQLVSLDEKSLSVRLKDEDAPRVYPRTEIESLDISAGRGSRGRGALYGALIGALGGAVALAADNSDDSLFTDGEAAAIGALFFAPIGAVVGLAVPPRERWKDVPLEGVRLTVRPVPGRGAGVFVTVSF
jgi:hypothetical protein